MSGLAGSVQLLKGGGGHVGGVQGSGLAYAEAASQWAYCQSQLANNKDPSSAAFLLQYTDQQMSADFVEGALRQATAQALSWTKLAADVAAATPTAETPVARVSDGPTKLIAAFFAPGAALVGDATNNATIGVYQRSGTGAPVLVASLTTTASWTAFVPMTIPLVGSPPSLAEGDVLTLAVAKNGAGVIVPAGLLQLLTGASS